MTDIGVRIRISSQNRIIDEPQYEYNISLFYYEGRRARKFQASAVRCQRRLISFVSCRESYSSFYFPHEPINTSDLDVRGWGGG